MLFDTIYLCILSGHSHLSEVKKPSVQFSLDVSFRKWHSGGTPINDTTNTTPVRLAECGDAEEIPKGIPSRSYLCDKAFIRPIHKWEVLPN